MAGGEVSEVQDTLLELPQIKTHSTHESSFHKLIQSIESIESSFVSFFFLSGHDVVFCLLDCNFSSYCFRERVLLLHADYY